jgi:tRNA uridine 5-carbamoylmethylation protein Kti12
MRDDIYIFDRKWYSMIRMMTDSTLLTEILHDSSICLNYIHEPPSQIYKYILDRAKNQTRMIIMKMQCKPYSYLDMIDIAEEY